MCLAHRPGQRTQGPSGPGTGSPAGLGPHLPVFSPLLGSPAAESVAWAELGVGGVARELGVDFEQGTQICSSRPLSGGPERPLSVWRQLRVVRGG